MINLESEESQKLDEWIESVNSQISEGVDAANEHFNKNQIDAYAYKPLVFSISDPRLRLSEKR